MLADASGLVEKIKRAAIEAQEASKPVTICFGEVVCEAPLRIKVEQKLILGERQLILTGNVMDYVTTVSTDWETEAQDGGVDGAAALHTHRITGKRQITVHNGLHVGESVIMIRQQEGQRFVVLDRTGGRL